MAILDKIIKNKKNTEEVVSKEPAKKKATKAAVKEIKEADVVVAPVNVKNDAYRVLVKPVITEKATLGEGKNKYTFIVRKSANKVEIKMAVKSLYGVNPIMVRVINVEGKRKQVGKLAGRRSDFKKAIVTLPVGKTISIHEGV